MTGISHDSNYAILEALAREVPADEAIVELGTFEGASALALGRGARAGKGAHVWTVDPHDLAGYRTTTGAGRPPRRPINFSDPIHRIRARGALKDAGLLDEHVTMVRAFSTDAAAVWHGPKVGLLYVDGDHREGAVRRDFAAWEPHLATDAIVLFDDYDAEKFPGVVTNVGLLVWKGLLSLVKVEGTLAILYRTKGSRR